MDYNDMQPVIFSTKKRLLNSSSCERIKFFDGDFGYNSKKDFINGDEPEVIVRRELIIR